MIEKKTRLDEECDRCENPILNVENNGIVYCSGCLKVQDKQPYIMRVEDVEKLKLLLKVKFDKDLVYVGRELKQIIDKIFDNELSQSRVEAINDSEGEGRLPSVPDLKLKDAKIVMKDGQLSVIEAIESSVPDFIDCLECNGSGVWVNDEYGNSYKFPVKCRDCNGSGKVKK